LGTVASGAYQRAVSAAAADAEVEVALTCAACPGFVEFVERDEIDTDQAHVLAERLLAPIVDAAVDTLLLGCTHYPYLARTIGDVVGRDVVLVSSADETAFEIRSILEAEGVGRHRGARKGVHRFLSSGDTGWFQTLGSRLRGPELADFEAVAWSPPPGRTAANRR
jgi:glutamate racemase